MMLKETLSVKAGSGQNRCDSDSGEIARPEAAGRAIDWR